MRRILNYLLFVLLTLMLGSCLKNENVIIYTDNIAISAGLLPDTVVVNSTFQLAMRTSVPTSCWHSITFKNKVFGDTLFAYWATARYENHGEVCSDVIQTKDTVINFTPTLLKKYVFQFLEETKVRIDTVVVKAQ